MKLERHLSSLRRWAIQQGMPSEEVEDALQEARLKYFQRRGVDYLEDNEPQLGLLRAIMHDAVADWYRAYQRRTKAEQHFASENGAILDETTWEEHLLGEQILERLPERWRRVVYWRYEEGLSWNTIGERLNSSAGVVSVQFRRALEKVYRELGIECRKLPMSSGIKDGDAKRERFQRRKNSER